MISEPRSRIPVTIEPEFLDKKATCAMLGGISVFKLDEFMRAGEIVPAMVGNRVMFRPSEIRRFARECPSWEPRR